ncbi:NADP-dependent 3-hydroxy acid dehydrogenase YdfG [Tessaracoccus bendigoensis DSM 12906]|uniref:NADP-dependent 3-hydroxy acid dehydrogenase YdfG n=1 Tax=Tessaracoccus bendigoensis DSM 12906 TaxID=1123357 RepID=A0A1M6A519_9ACTN|nr:SDR family NAD(P)-dependent oxidoreductase [Tessaracoccus bendigoensis]SHI31602.1 NADP-dependent 3-hydroxy acid dehydrogenase YdfG [Tessaracoccus bendigoensis DSM 12906]
MRTAVVTGASSGIGEATARLLASDGFRVVCAARRVERIEHLANEIGGLAVACDVTIPGDVARLAKVVGDRCDVLVNNAGGAIGLEPVAEADLVAWETMLQTNLFGTTRVTRALLPALIEARSVMVFVTSTAADWGYEGGAGYCAAKAAERSVAEALRLELVDQPVRITEICPGMVHTEEFSLTRFGGDQAKADAVYDGVAEPLTAADVADAIVWMATRPSHVNVDRMTIRPRAQAAQYKVHRG